VALCEARGYRARKLKGASNRSVLPDLAHRLRGAERRNACVGLAVVACPGRHPNPYHSVRRVAPARGLPVGCVTSRPAFSLLARLGVAEVENGCEKRHVLPALPPISRLPCSVLPPDQPGTDPGPGELAVARSNHPDNHSHPRGSLLPPDIPIGEREPDRCRDSMRIAPQREYLAGAGRDEWRGLPCRDSAGSRVTPGLA